MSHSSHPPSFSSGHVSPDSDSTLSLPSPTKTLPDPSKTSTAGHTKNIPSTHTEVATLTLSAEEGMKKVAIVGGDEGVTVEENQEKREKGEEVFSEKEDVENEDEKNKEEDKENLVVSVQRMDEKQKLNLSDIQRMLAESIKRNKVWKRDGAVLIENIRNFIKNLEETEKKEEEEVDSENEEEKEEEEDTEKEVDFGFSK